MLKNEQILRKLFQINFLVNVSKSVYLKYARINSLFEFKKKKKPVEVIYEINKVPCHLGIIIQQLKCS